MNFGGDRSAYGLSPEGPPIGRPRMAVCLCPSRARGSVATPPLLFGVALSNASSVGLFAFLLRGSRDIECLLLNGP